MNEETFDFIVTGAGSAGCAVAARLGESRRYRVMLLEAGQRDSNPWIHVPIDYHKLYTHNELNWKFESEPVPGLNGRTSYQPRGKMLGGTSSLNGMIYTVTLILGSGCCATDRRCAPSPIAATGFRSRSPSTPFGYTNGFG